MKRPYDARKIDPDEAAALYATGLTIAECAARYDVGEAKMLVTLRRSAAYAPRPARPRPKRDAEAVRALRRQGKSFGTIARALGISRGAVARLCRGVKVETVERLPGGYPGLCLVDKAAMQVRRDAGAPMKRIAFECGVSECSVSRRTVNPKKRKKEALP